MGTRTALSANPPISPLAEAVLAFEESDPDAVALLLPFDPGLTASQIEARARRQMRERPPGERALAISQAVAIQELIMSEAVSRTSATSASTPIQTIPGEERERCWAVLAEALERKPSMTASEGMVLLNAQGGFVVAHSTFHNVYWRQALERVSPEVRALREEMTVHRPGNGNLPRSSSDRVKVRELIAVIKRDHPEWHRGQIMDAVRRGSKFQFQDPIAFERHYVAMVEPAAPAVVAPTGLPRQLIDGGRQSAESRRPQSSRQRQSAPLGNAGAPMVQGASVRPFPSLLVNADPLNPAHLLPADDGRMQVCLHLQPAEAARCFQLMSLIYAEMAWLAIESAP
jgi:hypothetical protein